MRKIISVLVCLWVVANMFAVTYRTYQPASGTSFRSTSAYIVRSSVSSPCGEAGWGSSHTRPTAMGLTAISASNFESLNSEGGACYQPSAQKGNIKRGKVKEPDTEAVGEGVWESPVGSTPWILFALLAAAYALRKKHCLS